MSPVVANIYIKMFEEAALHALRICKRYGDNTVCVIKKEHVDLFLEHINSLCPTMQFTVELEKEGNLPFLGTLLTWGMEEKVNIIVYWT